MADMDAPFVLTGGGHFSIFFCAHQETQISFFLGAASVISRPVICQISSAVKHNLQLKTFAWNTRLTWIFFLPFAG